MHPVWFLIRSVGIAVGIAILIRSVLLLHILHGSYRETKFSAAVQYDCIHVGLLVQKTWRTKNRESWKRKTWYTVEDDVPSRNRVIDFSSSPYHHIL